MQIEGKLTLVRSIAGNNEHPSAKSIEVIRDTESGPLSSQVANASSRLYREMRDSNPLPEVFPNKSEQKDFEAEFEKIWRPMEEIEKLPADALPELYRSQYRNHIETHFPKLFDLIERRTSGENPDDPAAGEHGVKSRPPAGLGGGDADQHGGKVVGIVDWVDAEKKMKTFKDRFAGGTPSTLDIMMAQEDLWIYGTLLKVIRNTNDVGPDPKHDAKKYRKPDNHKMARIKQILAMDIGRDAVQSWSKCERALFNLPNEAGGAPPPPPTAHGGGVSSGASPLAGRYVDDKGKPLADATQQPYGEFRMMPINLKVVIEQREIPRLLAECANSAMRIDVRGVRILVQEPPPLDLTSPEASPGGQAPDSGTTPPSHKGVHLGGGHGNVHDDSGGGGESVYNEESADPVYPPVVVEVQGIIYIYNPPKVQTAGETAGDKGGQAPQVTPSNSKPAGSAAPIAPAASGTATNPSTKPSASGGRP